MIKFGRNEKEVTIRIEHGVFHGEEYFSFTLPQSHEYQAELLQRQFNENLNRHLRQIKEKYYNEGWKEAKAKTRKRTDFYGGWKY